MHSDCTLDGEQCGRFLFFENSTMERDRDEDDYSTIDDDLTTIFPTRVDDLTRNDDDLTR